MARKKKSPAPPPLPPPDLRGVVAKLDRAKDHVNLLYTEIDEWRARDGYVISDHIDLDDNTMVVMFRLIEPFPLRWGTILGDIVHNVRGALDHLVYQLVLLSGKNPKNRQTYWPFISNSSKDEYWNETNGQPPRRGSLLSGVNEEYRKIIDAVQPYSNPNAQLLGDLNRLSNTDKHNVLNVGLLYIDHGILVPAPPHTEVRIIYPKVKPERLQSDTELFRWTVDEPGWPRNLKVDLQRSLRLQIAFGKRPNTMTDITNMYVLTRKMLDDHFFPLFPPEAR